MIRGELRMNNHCVPDFEMDEDFNLPTFSTRPRKPSLPEDEVVELLWQNGQVIMQSQNQRSFRKLVEEEEEEVHNLFIQEDEMASWLNYPDPTLDHNFCTEILYPNPTHTPAMTTTTTVNLSVRPPILPGRRVETTVVGSSETPEFRVLEMAKRRAVAASNGDVPCEIGRGAGGVEEKEKENENENENVNCEMTVTSMSPGGSSASAEPPAPKPIANDRKRKGRALDDTECQSEDIEYESTDAKKQLRGSTSTKRSRAAEVHNLSERRRRDRINEKMKALQELIPRCNKTDKASMLDEAIEYLKTLQLQVQMMSMGCGMVPMMFSGVQQYMPSPMGMGIGMGMGMGMEMGMNRPMMQFPNLLAGSTLPMQAGAAHLGPRFPLPNFAMPPVPVSDPSRIQTPNLANQMLNSFNTQNTTQPMVSSLLDSYHQFLSSNHIQFPVTQAPLQNQPLVQSNTSRPCTSRGPENPKSHQPG